MSSGGLLLAASWWEWGGGEPYGVPGVGCVQASAVAAVLLLRRPQVSDFQRCVKWRPAEFWCWRPRARGGWVEAARQHFHTVAIGLVRVISHRSAIDSFRRLDKNFLPCESSEGALGFLQGLELVFGSAPALPLPHVSGLQPLPPLLPPPLSFGTLENRPRECTKKAFPVFLLDRMWNPLHTPFNVHSPKVREQRRWEMCVQVLLRGTGSELSNSGCARGCLELTFEISPGLSGEGAVLLKPFPLSGAESWVFFFCCFPLKSQESFTGRSRFPAPPHLPLGSSLQPGGEMAQRAGS